MRKDPHFLMFVIDAIAKSFYARKLDELDAGYSCLEAPDDFSPAFSQNKFHGMILDLNCFVRLSEKYQAIIKEYARFIPTLKLFLSHAANEVVIYQSNKDEKKISFDGFVKECAGQQARSLRRNQRYSVFEWALMDHHLTTMTDISRNGCYLVAPDHSRKVGDNVMISALEFKDQTPIAGVIRRKVHGSSKFHNGGIGVEFLAMNNNQRSELELRVSEYASKAGKQQKI